MNWKAGVRMTIDQYSEENGYGSSPEEDIETVTLEDGSTVDVVSPGNEWKQRHEERESVREQIRNRVRGSVAKNEYFRPAKPKPTIQDEEDKVVAVYARVSTNSTEQTSSIENQTKYYTKKISENPHWTLQEIYSDEGKSGTSLRHRDEFNRMMQSAAKKQMDIILCASVSRFARNMSDCLEQISLLKTMNPSHPIGVYFETENIYTLDPNSDQNLAIHAMLADWESANKSRRMILSYDQRILTGQYPVSDLLGYRHTKDGELVIQPEEAKTVRFIFLAFIGGYHYDEIAEILTEKQRPTLKGRVEWNGDMVKSVMGNERRWGDLEARKTIVVDYKRSVVVKNNSQRDSAYVPGHHEGIVTPEIARAARMLSLSSRSLEGGVQDVAVIEHGALKGFVSVHPGWNGVNRDMFRVLSQRVYNPEELERLEKSIRIRSGEEHSKVQSMNLHGYEVAPGILFLNRTMPAMTITQRGIKFNKVCHEKLDYCKYVEVLYHPLLQTIIIRPCGEENTRKVNWIGENGKCIHYFSAKAFVQAIYESQHWMGEYQFKFRGITKQRGEYKFMIFGLDEPQILVGKQQASEKGMNGGYIPYKTESREKIPNTSENIAGYAYPLEWRNGRDFNPYELHRKRDMVIDAISEADMMENGNVVENPMIGALPSKKEVLDELEELLMTM
jgi:DNA invertase Pin-like site-specific DNA recombinase